MIVRERALDNSRGWFRVYFFRLQPDSLMLGAGMRALAGAAPNLRLANFQRFTARQQWLVDLLAD